MFTDPAIVPVPSIPYGASYPTDQWPFLPRAVARQDAAFVAGRDLTRALRSTAVVEVPRTRAEHLETTQDGREVVTVTCRGIPVALLVKSP